MKRLQYYNLKAEQLTAFYFFLKIVIIRFDYIY